MMAPQGCFLSQALGRRDQISAGQWLWHGEKWSLPCLPSDCVRHSCLLLMSLGWYCDTIQYIGDCHNAWTGKSYSWNSLWPLLIIRHWPPRDFFALHVCIKRFLFSRKLASASWSLLALASIPGAAQGHHVIFHAKGPPNFRPSR